MRKLILQLLVIVMLVSLLTVTFATDSYFDGEGTEASPYIIGKAADLVKLAELTATADSEYASKYYKLTADIDFENAEYSSSIGVGTAFSGTFDGDGHVIKNLTTTQSGDYITGGLIGYSSTTATVNNLGIENFVSNNWKFGGVIVGYSDGVTITNCFVRNAKQNNQDYSGMVGIERTNPVVIKNSYVVGLTPGANAVSKGNAGAFVGSRGTKSGADITNCYTDYSLISGTNKGTADAGDVRAINSYVSATKETVPAYNLSDAFKNGRTNKNNGLPLLAWETVTAEDGDEFIPVLPDAPFDGEGTESSPYLINSKEDLLKLAEVSNSAKSASVLNSWFRLTADIDFANETFTTSIAVNAPFEGTFDGDGHVIKNITMSKGSETYGGLFSQAKGATFKNLGFENVSMASSWNQAGALVGWAEGITVEECFIRNITTTGTGNSG